MKLLHVELQTVFLFFAALTWAQTVQDDWVAPAAPDFTATLTIGELYTITWESSLVDSFPSYVPDADVSSVDLWITDYNLHVYSHRIAGMLLTVWSAAEVDEPFYLSPTKPRLNRFHFLEGGRPGRGSFWALINGFSAGCRRTSTTPTSQSRSLARDFFSKT